MGARAGIRAGVIVAIACVAALFAAPLARAHTADIIAPSDPHDPQVDSGWQAGTCTVDTPTCSIATPGQFFEQAGGHPPVGFTQFIVRNEPPGETPIGELKTVRVDLPVGLSVNPGATGRCPLATFEAGASGCEAFGAKVGESAVTASVLGVPFPPAPPLTRVPVYNVIPPNGEPARFGLELAGNEVFLKADVAWAGDYHEGFTIEVPKAIPVELAPLVEGAILKNRLVFDGTAGDGTFITTPSTCLGPAVAPHEHDYSTYLLAASYAEEEAQPGYAFAADAPPALESPIPPGTSPKECGTIPYEPSLGVDPGTAATDSPAGATVGVAVPHVLGGGNQDSSDTRTARVSLPAGMGLNPSAANGLQACTDAQFGKGTKDPVACPAASRVGTVTIESPPLPEGSLEGPVYVGRQLSRDPASGDEYRIFVDAESTRYGISVRLLGRVSADPRTGQLTTTFAENPQVPFTSFELRFDGGPRAVLTSPSTCGPNPATTEMTPWSGNAPATPSHPVVLTTAPGGDACAKTMAERPFAPGFEAKPKGTKAGAFSPFALHISRGDGQQELKGADVTLAPGMTGKLAGIPYCPEAALAAAAASAGAAEQATPSCPAASLVGAAHVAAGSGPAPLHIEGKAFLAGPYHGAPLSLAVVTPATAGPFDLGTVVVRVALFVDPETAQIRALSDPIPDVFGGAKLDVRAVDVDVDRKDFALNPTSCGPLTTTGVLDGGGADPANPAAFSAFPVSTPFQTTDCGALGFRPKLDLRLFGATRRSKHPRLRAVLEARPGDANIARAAVGLPHALFLDQSSLATICTRVQFAAGQCPRKSVYGHARAITPLLDKPLEGPVYLRSSDNPLPDMVAHLRGQVDVDLVGRIDSFHGGIRTTFDRVPDVPVSKFVMTLPGGRHGLLVASKNLCKGSVKAIVRLKGQNGKKANRRSKLRTPCRGKRHGAPKRHRHHGQGAGR